MGVKSKCFTSVAVQCPLPKSSTHKSRHFSLNCPLDCFTVNSCRLHYVNSGFEWVPFYKRLGIHLVLAKFFKATYISLFHSTIVFKKPSLIYIIQDIFLYLWVYTNVYKADENVWILQIVFTFAVCTFHVYLLCKWEYWALWVVTATFKSSFPYMEIKVIPIDI